MLVRQRITMLAAVLALVLAPFALAEDRPGGATGTWKWTSQGRQGNTVEWTLKLKQDGEKLTGAVLGTFGGNPTETAISEGTIKGNEISFTVVRERNDQKFVTKYSGKLEGDTIKGTTERDRNGEKVSNPWEAKRAAEATTQKAG